MPRFEFLVEADENPIEISDVITDLIEERGLTVNDMDYTQIQGMTVNGITRLAMPSIARTTGPSTSSTGSSPAHRTHAYCASARMAAFPSSLSTATS